jgi:hypothetical protein
MRRFDKQKNIAAAIIIEKDLTDRDSVTEDWKTNVAAGLATIGGVAGAKRTKNKPMAPQRFRDSTNENPLQNMLQPMVQRMIQLFPRTIPIVGIQSGVTDGKSGQSAVYVLS